MAELPERRRPASAASNEGGTSAVASTPSTGGGPTSRSAEDLGPPPRALTFTRGSSLTASSRALLGLDPVYTAKARLTVEIPSEEAVQPSAAALLSRLATPQPGTFERSSSFRPPRHTGRPMAAPTQPP